MSKEIQAIETVPDKAASLFLIIEKLASGKSADPAKISELLNVWERVNALQAKAAFDQAISEVKPKLPYIVKNNEVILGGGRGYSYEDLATISKSVDPVLAQHGLSYRFTTSSTPTTVTVTCKLSHSSGHSEENSLTANLDKSGSKNDIQALGSSVSYLSRYTLKASLGLAAGKDTDANVEEPVANINSYRPYQEPGGKPILVTSEQILVLQGFLKKTKTKEEALCKHYNVQSLADLSKGQFEDAQTRLKNKLDTLEVVQ